MLTKDLVQVTTRSGRLFPKFLQSSDPKMQSEAKELCDFFNQVPGRRFGDIEEDLKSSFGSGRKKSLAKLLLDRCKLAESDPSLLDWRWDVFRTAEAFRNECRGDFQIFTRRMQETFGSTLGDVREKIFSDLPSARYVHSFESITGRDLIDLFNLSQVKTILCFAQDVTLVLQNPTLAVKRAVMRQLRFFRLVGEPMMDPSTKLFRVVVSGPLGIFGPSSGYSTRIASFFSFVVSLQEWSLEANLKWKNKSLKMTLDHKSGVRDVSTASTVAFIPPEFKHVIESFKSDEHFVVSAGDEFIDFGGEEYCFPDFIVKHKGKKFFVELFHGSHRAQFERRLHFLGRNARRDIFLGVERGLLKDKKLRELVEASEWFKGNGFLFSQFPTPGAIKKVVMSHV
jgi:predicted nuclease of restriction endonuclease-like RecB superfamily